MTSESGKQTIVITIHILPNTQEIYHILLITKCDGKTVPRPFSKKIKIEHISKSIV